MASTSSDEKDMASEPQSEKKQPGISSRRASNMSIEEPHSPASNSTDSDHEEEEEEDDYQPERRQNQLRPSISHTSSMNQVGNVIPTLELMRTWTTRTSGTATDPAYEIDFAPGEKGDPQNWPLWYKGMILAIMSYSTTSVVLFSTSYTSAIPGMEDAFGISNSEGILGVTTYLIGMAVGSVILAPLSEMYGRRPIYIMALGGFVVFVIPCAVATNIQTILVTRFFGAFCAAAMISNAPGTVNDIVDEEHRALAFSIWSIGPMNGPVIGPVVGGFVYQYLGWRWTNWVVIIGAGVAWVLTSIIQETYAPAILRRRAAKKRKETGDDAWWSRYDEKLEFLPLLRINLSRPFVMTVTEPICIFWDLYIALIYGILYLCFVAYPIVFTDLRGWSPGFTGLSFCGIGVGSMITIVGEPLIRKWINSHKNDPETGSPPPEAMVCVVCLAAVLIPAGEIIFAWTCTPNVHWIAPIIAGVPFGAGNAAVFIYASNYLVSSYDIYAASALAGNAVLRSVMGATLPLAGPSMYKSLGANWAGTLLGLLEVLCIPIPIIFYKYGHKIRLKSTLIREMREDREKRDRRQKRFEEKAKRRAETEAQMGAPMDTGTAVVELGVEGDLEKGGVEKVKS
ncbi:uncharacterized protein LTR77_006779 [Saxophila tyrrhenica]|uniref:Cercosporin MFS transporter CTB4 n=1 Tax=Saxophila tyrrhenica TaxID=1690608 RepID=A0AAV9P962_9PEZI|nr:hypothetical protein LTR77_006779 [Saxophila tyrrhenica]